jgi:hypothetical protein
MGGSPTQKQPAMMNQMLTKEKVFEPLPYYGDSKPMAVPSNYQEPLRNMEYIKKETESPKAKKLDSQRKQYEGQQLESMSTAFSNADHPNSLGRDAKTGQFNGVKAQGTNKSNINTTADEAMMDL